MSAMRERMAALLEPLQMTVFDFEDQSHLHAGHAGNRGGGHYALLVVSPRFEGQSRLARQRSVQKLLAGLFAENTVHALSLKLQTPAEYFR